MSTVTAIILARNEEKHIVDCIKSIQFADEILVIDDGSTDQTVPLATNLGAKVISHPLGHNNEDLVYLKHILNGFYL